MKDYRTLEAGSGQQLYQHARRLIPGGTQLLSKRPEMYLPQRWPAYYSKARGVEVWDLDGQQYIDMTINGVGTCPLGAGDADVDQAVKAAIQAGNMSTLNPPEEVELAELLLELHPWADMVRYVRTGGEAMAVAVRLVRATTGKDRILFCGYHGWHDWYLSANLAESSALDEQLLPGLKPLGVPRALQGTVLPFTYNDLPAFERLFRVHQDNLAAVVMEPVRSVPPQPEFLTGIRDLTMKAKVPLVFDEITSGYRLYPGGVHMTYKVEPDLAVFAKGMGNGYPIGAVIGEGWVMEKAQDTFISSTYWTDRIGPAAALATTRKFRENTVHEHLTQIGLRIQEGWKDLAGELNLPIHVSGIPPLSHWRIEVENAQILHTLVVERMLLRGFLTSNAFYATYAHSPEHVDRYLTTLKDILTGLAPSIHDGTFPSLFDGKTAHTGFKRLT